MARSVWVERMSTKTHSGKTICRLIRSLAKGENITQETSKLETPAFLDQLGDEHRCQWRCLGRQTYRPR
jgi:hypothetical protein